MSNSEDSQQYLNDMLVKEEDEASGGKRKTIHNRVFCCLTLIFHPRRRFGQTGWRDNATRTGPISAHLQHH